MRRILAEPATLHSPDRLAAIDALDILDTPAEEGFDAIAHLASSLCATPVALVSLVARDRQWFKARVGFSCSQTDLNSSVCAHALDVPDLLVITDLASDPRTSANPLVTNDPFLRFYAGAPLRLSNGHVLGTLCVIDHQPRPEGLTMRQAADLRALASQVVAQLDLRHLVKERDALISERLQIQIALAESEVYWRGLFEQLREGLAIGEVVRDQNGRVVDWRYLEVNATWGRLIGIRVEDAVGRTIRDLLPEIEAEWVDEPAYVVDTGEAVAFTRRIPRLDRWFEGRISPLAQRDRFVLLFLDVTERIAIEEAFRATTKRKAALAQLGDQLRTTMDPDAMGYNLAAISGPILAASQAAYASIDGTGERVTIKNGWSAAGASTIEGCHDLREFGSIVKDLKAGRVVSISDVGKDARTSSHTHSFDAIGTAGFIGVPVVEADELVAVFVTTFAAPRTISREDEEFAKAACDRARAAIARRRAEDAQSMLNQEISHRLKNTLAMVQAIAHQTLKGISDREEVATFEGRLMALGTAHDILLRNDWDVADLADVVGRVADLAGGKGRIDADGPPVNLGPRAALSTSLLLHELTTNASKYGALTQASGKIVVRWWLEDDQGTQTLALDWRETGGPPASLPKRKGFGSRLLAMGLIGTGGTRLDYADRGLEARFRAPLKHVERT